MKKLSSDEIQREINKLNGWTNTDNAINKEYKLKDFTSALSFINNIGEEAETMNHHPDLFLHSYNKVKITLSTHSEGGLTMNDFNLANKIESIYNK